MADNEKWGVFASMGLPEVREQLDAMADEVKGIFDPYKDESGTIRYEEIDGESDGPRIQELNAKMAQARQRFEHLQELAGTAEQAAKLAAYMRQPLQTPAQPPAKAEPAQTLGQAVYKALRANPRVEGQDWGFSADVNRFKGTKAVLGTDSALTDVGAEYPPESVRVGTIVETLYQPHNIAPLIPSVATAQNAIPYMVETVTTEGAAEKAEGALGAEAVIDWAETTAPIRKITVLQPITEELLMDEGGMRAIVDGRLRQFVGNREDLQLLTGDGIAPNLTGILNTASIQNTNYSLTGASAQGLAEAALSTANLVREAFSTPGNYVMRVGTWEYIRLAKDTQNNYLFAGPADVQAPRLWGLPVTTNENMDDYITATDVPILVGDFAGSATIFRRQGVTVQVSDSHDDRFARGVLTIRLLERLGLVVWRPSAFATVTRTA